MSHHCDSSFCTSQVLQKSLTDRISCYKGRLAGVVTRACMYFTYFLMQRDYDGKLCFNHDRERLEMQVCEHACVLISRPTSS